MSKLKYLIIHCTATNAGRKVTKEEIILWHTAPTPEGRGWKKVGYSDMIMLDGSLVNLVKFDQDNFVQGYEMTNGAKGINSASRHVVYVGGQDSNKNPKDTRTNPQIITLSIYVKYMVKRHPDIMVAGHNQFSSYKLCPSFNVPKWCKNIGLPDKNIYTKDTFGNQKRLQNA